jgi:sensor histidine kinase YesM
MRRSLRSTGVALLVGSALAILEMYRTSLTRITEGHPLTLDEFSHRILPTWITIVLTSPWCAWMAQRYPVRAGQLGRTLLVHFAGGTVFVAIHMVLMIAFHFTAATLGDHLFVLPSAPLLIHSYFFYIGMEMSVYAAIVIVLLLLEARREASDRALAAAHLERSVTAARLESLQAQIRPHFLFNTLNTLAVLARRGDGAAVDRAIGDLGDLLRASFESPGRHEVALGEDLTFLEGYLNLQRLRFPDRLEIDWQIEDPARSALVPVLLVQPLVENALEHGLATANGGRVRVAARRNGDMLELEVSDEGPGFGSRSEAGDEVPGNGVGLANTRERLALLYGNRATLTCGDRTGGGGEVRVRLPWRTAGAGA